METVYESRAINRSVYSTVAATGFQQPEGKTQRRARLSSQAGVAVNTQRGTHDVDVQENSERVKACDTGTLNLVAIVKLNN